MTPTPEEVALADLIAGEPHGELYDLARTVALAAMMKVRKKAAAFLEGKAARNEETAVWTENLSVRKNSKRDALIRRSDAQDIRNGEHLR